MSDLEYQWSSTPQRRWTLRPRNAQAWLLLITVLLVVVVMFAVVVSSLIETGVRHSEPYDVAVSRAQHNPTMLQKLGSPIVAGRTTSATLNTNNDAGDADLTIPLQGPFGKGKLHVVAERKAYKWAYREMRFVADGSGETVDLRTATDKPTRP
jgi:hypothetical protein